MDTDFGLLPEPPTEKVSSDDPYAFKLFDSGNETQNCWMLHLKAD